eukprot:g14798.t1
MDRQSRHRGLVAAAGMALLLADAQGFAFTLQHRASRGRSTPTAAVGGLAAAREISSRGSGSVATAAAAAAAPWGSRRPRTALRMASEESPGPLGGSGGAAAAEAVPPDASTGTGATGTAGAGGDVAKAGEAEALAETEQSEKLRLTAEKLKLQAEKLRLEVEKEQLMLQAEKLQEKEALEKKQDALISKMRVLNGRQEELTALVKQEIKRVNADLFMRLADVAETTLDVEERNSLVSLSEDVMRAVDKVDKGKALKVSKEIKETLDRAEEIEKATRARAAAQALVQAQNASYGSISESLSAMKGNEGSVEDMLNIKGLPSAKMQDLRNLAGMGGDNSTVGADGLPAALSDAMNVMFLPLWVPTSLLKFVGSAPALLEADIEAVKSDVLGMDTFYVTGMEKSPFAALYKGNMRGKDSEEVFEAVTAKLESIPGLADRVQLFLMGDPTPLTPEEAVQMGDKPVDPVFMLISKEAKPGQTSKIIGLSGTAITFLGTAFTAFAYGIGNFALRPEFYEKINEGDVAVAGLAIPIMMGVLALQAAHEIGHWAMAGTKGVKMGTPIFIPSLQTGLFGAITPLLSFPKNRKDYFDVASAGPLLGTIVSLAVFVAGIMMTGSATPEALELFPLVPAGLFHSSLLIGIMTSIGLPNVMGLAIASTVPGDELTEVGDGRIVTTGLLLFFSLITLIPFPEVTQRGGYRLRPRGRLTDEGRHPAHSTPVSALSPITGGLADPRRFVHNVAPRPLNVHAMRTRRSSPATGGSSSSTSSPLSLSTPPPPPPPTPQPAPVPAPPTVPRRKTKTRGNGRASSSSGRGAGRGGGSSGSGGNAATGRSGVRATRSTVRAGKATLVAASASVSGGATTTVRATRSAVREEAAEAPQERHVMVARTMKELLLRNKWQSVIHAERLWPGEYQNPVDSAGNPHHPWGMNIAYFECCTGTPYADGMRASAFVATRMPPDDMASLLVWVASLHGRAFKVQSCSRRDADESEGFFGVEAEPVLVKDGSSSVQFSIRCQHDSGVGGPICTITAFSSAASTLLARHAAGFDEGTFTVVPHGRFESTVQTSLGLKRLVRVVEIDEHATDSTELAAHFTLEDEDDPAAADAADRPCASHGKNGYTLGDHVIARCIVAFYNGGWDSCVSPTIESIMARRDHHGHGLTISLFDAVEKWFLREWTLDIKEGMRMMQATQLGNVIVDGVPKAGGAAAAAAANESEPCAGLDFVTDKQLLYNTRASASTRQRMAASRR